jgi:hypothetical protein
MEESKLALVQKLELDKQALVIDIDKVIEAIAEQSEERMQTIEKNLSEVQWYLGEEKAKNQQLENDVQGKNQYIQKIEEDLRKLTQHYDESQWYLREEKAKREQSENALKNSIARCQDLESQLNQLRIQLQTTQKELQTTQWYLGEERARQRI